MSKPSDDQMLKTSAASITMIRYAQVKMKKKMSLRKKEGVTWIFLMAGPFGSVCRFDAPTVRETTTLVMKKVPPTMMDIDFVAAASSMSDTAAMAAKTSGAPLPRAKRVTPASDSGILNASTIASSDGDKYSSAVDDSKYIPTTIKKIPTGKKP